MTKVLFTGITGLLGRYFLFEKLPGFEIVGTYKSNLKLKSPQSFQLDVSNKNNVDELFKKIRPEIVIHAASLGSVDYCETHEEEALSVNVEGTKNVVSACEELGSSLVFISSNAVFDGENPPYNEESLVNPPDVYGKTKVQGEEIVRNSKIGNTIVRLMTMYGWNNPSERENPVTWVINQLKAGKKINVVTDIYNNHLYAAQAAEALWKILLKDKKNETFNIAGKDCLSRYELAMIVADFFKLDKGKINPVANNFFKEIAPRPKNTCFDTKKMEKDLDIEPLYVKEGLGRMRSEING